MPIKPECESVHEKRAAQIEAAMARVTRLRRELEEANASLRSALGDAGEAA